MSLSGVRTASTAVVALTVAASLLAPGLLTAAGLPMLVLAAVAGLPHGAADVVLLRDAGGGAPAARLLGYALLAAGAVLVTVALPGPCLAALLVLSVAHFAEGESRFDALTGGPGSRLSGLGVATAIVVLPPVVRPGQVRAVLEPLAPELAGLLLSGGVRLLLAAPACALICWAVLCGSGRARGEVALVAALAVLAPPMVAFATWFAGWHALRHLGRLAAQRGAGDVRRLLQAAALPTLGGAALLGALCLRSGGPSSAVLLGLLGLTVPHSLTVQRALGGGALRRGAGLTGWAGPAPRLPRRRPSPG